MELKQIQVCLSFLIALALAFAFLAFPELALLEGIDICGGIFGRSELRHVFPLVLMSSAGSLTADGTPAFPLVTSVSSIFARDWL